MPITFNCLCGKILASKERDAGLPAVCPNCGRRVMVPGERTSQPDSQEEFRKAAARAEDWLFAHQRQIWVASAALVLLIVGGALAYLQLWPRWQESRQGATKLTPSVADTPIALDEQADPNAWRTSFDSFAVAAQRALSDEAAMKAKFEGQEIRWTVTFQYALERTQIYFLEAEPLRNKTRGIAVWATILNSEAPKAQKLKRGQKFTLQGKLGPITSARSADHPEGYTIIRPLECVLSITD